MNAIEVKHITKRYDKLTALDDISFEVQKAETLGLIGPDGAGKTSLFRILTTLILPDGGRATVEGLDTTIDYKQIRSIVGYMPGRFSLYQDLTVEENLKFFSALFHTDINTNFYLIESLYRQIEPFKKRRAGKLSGGMKQKLALCCALIHKPKVLFLDEPTTGVDPVSRNEFWEMLSALKKEGISILVSTPYMDEASRCDRIALIRDGRILEIDTPSQLTGKFKSKLWRIRSNDMHKLLLDIRSYPYTDSCFPFGEYHHVTLQAEHVDGKALRDYLESRGQVNLTVEEIPATIEDCYLKMTN